MIGAAGGMGLWAARYWFAELEDVRRVTLCDIEPLSDAAWRTMSPAGASIDYVRIEYGQAGANLVDWSAVASSAASPDSPPRLREVDLVVLAVPPSAIADVMDGIARQLARDAWLIDMSSVKGPPIDQMLEKAGDGVSVVGTHPLFGITGDSITGRTVALVPTGRGNGELIAWLDRGLHRLGALTMQVPSERHDRYMLIAQTMTHFALLAFAEAVTGSLRDDESLEELRKFGTPPYLAMGNVTGRLLTQNHRLYAAIQQSEGAGEIREAFASAARTLADAFRNGTLGEIEAEIDSLAARYGPDELATATRLSEKTLHAATGESDDDGV